MSNFRKHSATAVLLVCFAGLSACGGGGSSSGGDDTTETTDTGNESKESGVCGNGEGATNQDALASENCKFLSSYRLFKDPQNPTASPNANGVPYELTTPLFSDYTSKYRFIFVPGDKAVQYDDQEAFDFPVGTVISKTFSMPADTAFRGFDDETLIETRLLIHREAGWATLPYIWNDDFTDATLQIAGGEVNLDLVHNGRHIPVAYQVPDKNQCKQCHQLNTGDNDVITPIGPKARLLNRDYAYASGTENQLRHWEDAGILEGLPADTNTIQTVPAYTDEDAAGLSNKTDAELTQLAKGYLDINCSHCHRPEGGSSNTGLHLEYWRDLGTAPTKHGLCKKPVAYGGGSLSYDVVPGDAEKSILHFRMASNKPGDKMPELSRSIVHEEGLELVAAWINSLEGGCGN